MELMVLRQNKYVLASARYAKILCTVLCRYAVLQANGIHPT
uniref:Uncharacterized protein n=1 Tax=Arundo donax TaxID=35708 RepID=A0A0A9D0P7_ARUDO